MSRILFVCLSFVVTAVLAQEGLPVGSEFELFVENDMWAKTDRYYTNGIKFGVGLPLEILEIPAKDLLQQLTDGNAEAIHAGVFLGQNIYTPRNIHIATPQPGDRPWAAWLYVGGVAQLVRDNRLDTVEIDVGAVGPPALGKQVQTEWHKLIGVATPQGWANQTTGEAAFLASYLQKRKYSLNGLEVIPHAGVTLGTVMTLARAGATVRFGENMTGFGPDTIEPGGAILHDARRATNAVDRRDGLEWSAFAGFDQRLIGYNILLDGDVFHHGPSVNHRPHVFDLTAGISLRWRAVRFSWTRVHRSEEFYTATSSGGRQTFDSLNLGVEL